MPPPARAANTPMTRAQRNWEPVGLPTGGRSETAIPPATMRRKAPVRGEPSRVATAAKLPAAPITTLACSGASRLMRWTASTLMPLPMAMRGASGPRTTPRLSVAKEARKMPGSSMGVGRALPLGRSHQMCGRQPGQGHCIHGRARPAGRNRRVGPSSRPAAPVGRRRGHGAALWWLDLSWWRLLLMAAVIAPSSCGSTGGLRRRGDDAAGRSPPRPPGTRPRTRQRPPDPRGSR